MFRRWCAQAPGHVQIREWQPLKKYYNWQPLKTDEVLLDTR